MDYKFIGLDEQPKITYKQEIEGIQFGNFDSRNFFLWLTERNAPTPEENEIVETVPYMQGQYDFSIMEGNRFFKNRELTYKFMHVDKNYRNRSGLESHIKRLLMPQGIGNLYDTHDSPYHWRGKCSSVEVEDDSELGVLNVTITFNCYPFAISNHEEGTDYWDDVDFNNYVWQPLQFDFNGTKEFEIENLSGHDVEGKVELVGSGQVELSGPSISTTLKNDFKANSLIFKSGLNKLTGKGNGTLKFVFTREELL